MWCLSIWEVSRLRWWHDNLCQGISFICHQSQLEIEMEVEMEIYSYWLLVNYLNHKDETRTNIDVKFEDSSEYYIHHKFWNTVEPKNDKHGSCVLRSVDFVSVFVSFKVTSLALGQAYDCHKASERPSIILLNINSEFKTTLWTKASNLPQSHIQSSAVRAQSNIIRFCTWYDNEWCKICISGYIHKRQPISRPYGRAMGCLLWGSGWSHCISSFGYTIYHAPRP